VVPLSYHDFFAGCATVSGALIGLLFVAISVSPEKLAGDTASADHQVKAGAAFSALINTLVIALIALLPGTRLGPASVALAAAGLASTTGLIILLWREHKERIRPGQVVLLVGLIVLYGLQLANGLSLNGSSPREVNAVDNQAVLAIVFFLFAIARAWQLVGARDTSLLSTVADLAQRQARQHPHLADGDPAPDAGPASRQDDGGK
jgi:hypothetical protein